MNIASSCLRATNWWSTVAPLEVLIIRVEKSVWLKIVLNIRLKLVCLADPVGDRTASAIIINGDQPPGFRQM